MVPVRAVPFPRMAQLGLDFVSAASVKVALVRVVPVRAAPYLDADFYMQIVRYRFLCLC